MENQKTVYVLRNDELGYISDCPVFTTKEEASKEAAFKCREHSVFETHLDKFEPCHPKKADGSCKACAIYYKNLE